MRKPPERLEHVRYHPAYALFDLTRVSRDTELAHRRMCDWYWHTGEWPALLRGNAAALCRVPPRRWQAVVSELECIGWSCSRGRIHHSGVHQVRAEAVAALRSRRTRGRMGAERRWTHQKAHGQASGPDGPPNASPMAQLCPPHSTAIAKPCQVKGKSKSTSTTTSTTKEALNAERLACIASPHEKSPAKEKAFLAEVKELLLLYSPAFAKDELANWGGWWRNRFREKPAKAQRLIAELRAMIREGRVSANPGAAAVDLWNRLP